jgi:trans-2,3-dihydro-3-hydroxyanthranilate isomerase
MTSRAVSVHRVRVFLRNRAGGSDAGVVADATGLSVPDMMRVAKHVGATETAFLFPSTDADTRIRWFTSTAEVGVCIHATIAAAAIVRRNRRRRWPITFAHGAEVIKVWGGRTAASVQLGPFAIGTAPVNAHLLSIALGIELAAITGLPSVVCAGGERELVVRLSDSQTLLRVHVDRRAAARLCRRIGVAGVTLFSSEGSAVYAREFAPLYGYLEDPACGLAAGAIATLLKRGRSDSTRITVTFTRSGSAIQVRSGSRTTQIGGRYALCGTEEVILRHASPLRKKVRSRERTLSS